MVRAAEVVPEVTTLTVADRQTEDAHPQLQGFAEIWFGGNAMSLVHVITHILTMSLTRRATCQKVSPMLTKAHVAAPRFSLSPALDSSQRRMSLSLQTLEPEWLRFSLSLSDLQVASNQATHPTTSNSSRTMTQAPAPEASISDKICTALVHTVEFLIPPLKRSLQWEPSDFGEILPVRKTDGRLPCTCVSR